MSGNAKRLLRRFGNLRYSRLGSLRYGRAVLARQEGAGKVEEEPDLPG